MVEVSAVHNVSGATDASTEVMEWTVPRTFDQDLVEEVLLVLLIFGMGGNFLLFRVTHFMVQKKREAGESA